METNPGEMILKRREARNVLGVREYSGEREIRKAYREIVLNYHPDTNPSDPEARNKMIEANKARHILKKPKSEDEKHLEQYFENFFI